MFTRFANTLHLLSPRDSSETNRGYVSRSISTRIRPKPPKQPRLKNSISAPIPGSSCSIQFPASPRRLIPVQSTSTTEQDRLNTSLTIIITPPTPTSTPPPNNSPSIPSKTALYDNSILLFRLLEPAPEIENLPIVIPADATVTQRPELGAKVLYETNRVGYYQYIPRPDKQDHDDDDRIDVRLRSLLVSLKHPYWIAKLGTSMSRKDIAMLFCWQSARELRMSLGCDEPHPSSYSSYDHDSDDGQRRRSFDVRSGGTGLNSPVRWSVDIIGDCDEHHERHRLRTDNVDVQGRRNLIENARGQYTSQEYPGILHTPEYQYDDFNYDNASQDSWSDDDSESEFSVHDDGSSRTKTGILRIPNETVFGNWLARDEIHWTMETRTDVKGKGKGKGKGRMKKTVHWVQDEGWSSEDEYPCGERVKNTGMRRWDMTAPSQVSMLDELI